MDKPRIPVWTPYISDITIKSGDKVHIEYKGGSVTIHPEDILSLMIYGYTEPLSQELLELFGKYGIPIVIHRRNVEKTVWIHSGPRSSKHDILTSQILTREDLRKRTYVARRLIYAKFRHYKKTHGIRAGIPLGRKTIDELRNIEAVTSKNFWEEYFESLGQTQLYRRGNNAIGTALDACSKFIAGILLRWISYHHLSPYHGFLHTPTTYPSLVYDLMEPYRYIIYQSVKLAYDPRLLNENLKLTAVSIEKLKELLNEEIYCPQTRQYVRRQELLHGVTLALRAYLLNLGKRFVIPREGVKKGGRPMKTNYTLPGKSAGYSKIYRPKQPPAELL